MRLVKNYSPRSILRTVRIASVFLCILCLTASGLKVYAGTPYLASDVLGQADYSSSFPNGLSVPNESGFDGRNTQLALDSANHHLFVADGFNRRVVVYNLDNNNHIKSHTASHVLGQPDLNTGTVSNTPTASSIGGQSSAIITGIAFDSAHHRLFVSDYYNNRILVYNLTSGITNNMNASYVLGQSSFNTNDDNGLAPTCMTYDSSTGLLYVANSYRGIWVYDLSDGITSGMDANYVLAADPDQRPVAYISDVRGLAVDSARHYLFAAGDWKVLVYNTSNLSDNMDASLVLGQSDINAPAGTAGCTEDPQARSACSIWGNGVLSYDSVHKRLFVGDMGRLLVFNLTSGITNGMDASYVLGESDFTTYNDITPTSQSTFNSNDVSDVMYDSSSNQLFVADGGNNRILSFSVSTITNGMNASNVLGQTDQYGDPHFTTYARNNTNITNRGFDTPGAITLDTTHHRMFVSDTENNRVMVYLLDRHNQLIHDWADYILGQQDQWSGAQEDGQNGMNQPDGLAYDPVHDRLFVGDMGNYRILVFNCAHFQTGMNASYVLGEQDFEHNTSLWPNEGQAGINRPAGLAYDTTTGYLYSTDNSRVMVYNTTHIANGMNASYVLGQSNFDTYGFGGGRNQHSIAESLGVSIDSQHHRLFVADRTFNRILVFDTSSLHKGMDASYVIGQANFTGNRAPGLGSNRFVLVIDVAYDSNNDLLFAVDQGGNRILIFDTSALVNNGIAPDAIGVLGQPDFNTSAVSSSQFGFNFKSSGGEGPAHQLVFDSSTNNLSVADVYNNRILTFGFAQLESTLPTATVGSSYSTNLGSQTQGTPLYTLDSGSLPRGLSLNANTGKLSGTPTLPGTYNFTVSLSDDNGVAGTFSDNRSYTMVLGASASTSPSGNSSTSNTSTSGSDNITYTSFQNLPGSSSPSSNSSSNPNTTSANNTSTAGSAKKHKSFFSNPLVLSVLILLILAILEWLKRRLKAVRNK